MRKILLVAVAVAMLTVGIAGIAVAKTFVCQTVPCEGTNNPDKIGERNGSVQDVIRANGGDDFVNAARASRDADRVLGDGGDDVLDIGDGDIRDNANCGSGADIVIIDLKFNNTLEIDGTRGCETIVFNFQGAAEEFASMSNEEVIANSTPVSAEERAAAEASYR